MSAHCLVVSIRLPYLRRELIQGGPKGTSNMERILALVLGLLYACRSPRCCSGETYGVRLLLCGACAGY